MTPKASQVRDLITGMRSRGLEVGLRDVSFVALSRLYGDEPLAYRSVFGDAEMPLDEYMAQEKVEELMKAADSVFPDEQTVTFDELKSGLIDDLRSLEKLRDAKTEDGYPALDAKEMATVVARIADIRVKLTEKFNTTERVIEQRVVVEQKYTNVCPYCHHEFALAPLDASNSQ